MLRYLIVYVCTALVFWLADACWLGFVVKDLYQRELGGLLLDAPQKIPAILFYLMYVVGMIVFAVLPALERDSWLKALCYGALLGLIAYATYDLSNLATLKGWSTKLALIDIGWGAFVTGMASCAGFWVSRTILARL